MDAVRDAETTMYHVAMSILKNDADYLRMRYEGSAHVCV